jgi:hypothetical protein
MQRVLKELLEQCQAALDGGSDFPTIWDNFLQHHDLVVDIPRSAGAVLYVSLITGDELVLSDRFSIVEHDATS